MRCSANIPTSTDDRNAAQADTARMCGPTERSTQSPNARRDNGFPRGGRHPRSTADASTNNGTCHELADGHANDLRGDISKEPGKGIISTQAVVKRDMMTCVLEASYILKNASNAQRKEVHVSCMFA